MINVLIIPEYCDSTVSHPANKWGGTYTTKSLLGQWSLLTLDHIASFQRDTMDY